jgi:DNA-binding MarR family transcriptional regulator
MKGELNDNDNKLLAYCFNRRRHLSDIARELGIDVKNVSTRIDKLRNMNLIKVETISNRKYVRTLKGDKTKEYFIEILSELKDRGGILKQDEFLELVPFSFDEQDFQDKYSAPLKLMYLNPKLVEHYIKITPEGEKFLKENESKN